MRRGKNKALGRVMAGYVLFAVCSILAITIYYLDSSLPYSPAYMLGIFGFILLLAETAGQRVLEQINENANMAVYAKLAYRDVLTALATGLPLSGRLRRPNSLPLRLATSWWM